MSKKDTGRPKGRAKAGVSAEVFDDGSVYVHFKGKSTFKPAEFAMLMMPIFEDYTEHLLIANSRDKVYDLWNQIFGQFLSKILTEEEIYGKSEDHKEYKENVEKTLDAKSEDLERQTELNRLAAVGIAKHLLLKVGIDEESVHKLLKEEIFDETKRVGADIELPEYSDRDPEKEETDPDTE